MWVQTTLGEIAEIVSGATPSTSVKEYWDGDIRWVTPKDLSELDGSEISHTARSISVAGLRSCAASVLPANSVLLSSRAPIGLVAINRVPMATNQGFKSLVPDPRRVDSRFLYWWLKKHRPLLESLGNGATFKEISKKSTAAVPISLPPIEEQRRIAAILDAADALRAKRRQALDKLDTLTQSIFVEMFGEPGANPQGFAISPMIDIVDPQRPITYGILKPGENFSGGVPYVRVVDMIDGSIDSASLKRTTPEISLQYRRSLLQKGDVLMSIRGHVGRLAMVEEDVAGANITQDTARLAITGANPTFILECLRTDSIQRWMSTFTKGAAVRGINLTDIKRLPIPLPPREMQDRFAQAADEARRQRAVHREAASQSGSLCSSLQHHAFRGEL